MDEIKADLDKFLKERLKKIWTEKDFLWTSALKTRVENFEPDFKKEIDEMDKKMQQVLLDYAAEDIDFEFEREIMDAFIDRFGKDKSGKISGAGEAALTRFNYENQKPVKSQPAEVNANMSEAEMKARIAELEDQNRQKDEQINLMANHMVALVNSLNAAEQTGEKLRKLLSDIDTQAKKSRFLGDGKDKLRAEVEKIEKERDAAGSVLDSAKSNADDASKYMRENLGRKFKV